MLAKRKILLTAALVCALVIVCGCFGIRTFAAEGHTADNGAVTQGTNSRTGNWADYVLDEGTAWFNSTAAGIAKTGITKVIFSNTVPTGYTASWDASKNDSNKVIAYLVGTEVTIVGNGGQIILLDCSYMFGGFSQLVSVEGFEILDTADATDMSNMFYECRNLSSLDLSGFDTGNVTNMNGMFYNCNRLSSLDLSGFDTGNVTDMNGMFYECNRLTSLDLSGFDTGNVTDMGCMFYYCNRLSSLDVSSFDTSNVRNMGRLSNSIVTSSASGMFAYCGSLSSLDLSGFNTGNVTDMDGMFFYCRNLSSLNLSGFNTSNVTKMSNMFYLCDSLSSLDVSGFNTGNVTNMSRMFYQCSSLSSLNVSGFNTGNVTNMSYMFYRCSSLSSLDVSGFNTEKVTNMSNMFNNCRNLSRLDVSNWNTSNVTDMSYMFNYCQNLTSLDVSGFDTEKVMNMWNMFNCCQNLSRLDVSGFNTGNVVNMYGMFDSCTGLNELDVSGFDTGKVVSMYSMFDSCTGLSELDVSGFDTGNVTNMYCMFNNCTGLSELDVSGFDTGNVTDISNMFNNCTGLSELDVSGFDTGKVTNMRNMFNNCTGLSELDVSGFDTGNVTNMYSMFKNCTGLSELDVSGFDTENVTDMSSIFYNCTGLGELDVSSWNTGNVTDMYGMFYNCTSLSGLDVSNWNTGNVTDMSYMIYGCTGLSELDVSGWNTGNVETMSYMFNDCTGLSKLDVCGWNTVNVTDMNGMFYNCSSLKTILADNDFTMSSQLYGSIYRGQNLSGGNGETYRYLSMQEAKSEAVCDCHETPGFLTYNGTDKCVVNYDLNYEGASTVDFTQQVKQGKSITVGGAAGQVPNPTRTDYEFLGWGTSPDSAVVYQAGDGVPTDSAGMTLYAQWEKTGYNVTIDWQDGGNTSGPISVSYGKKNPDINISIIREHEPDGYSFGGLYTEPNGLGKLYVNIDGTWYRDWDIAEDTTLYAFWKKYRVDYFVDVREGEDWFYDDVYFMYDRGLMLGMGNSTTFGPYLELTRSQFVMILYRMARSPEDVVYEDRFPDVAEGKWYSTPVLWAYKTGIVTGYDSGYFGPNDSITREQMAVMLYKYVSWKGGFDITARADLSGFEDADRVSSWAYEAVSWAVAEGVIRGKKNGTLIDPQGVTARCECSAMVQRYCDAAK